MSSQAESISAWYAVLLWPSMVAALRTERYLVARSSAGPEKSRLAVRERSMRPRARARERGIDRPSDLFLAPFVEAAERA